MKVMKKTYQSPLMGIYTLETAGMLAASQLDKNKDNQQITPTNEEYNGEFGANGFVDWGENDEEDW